MSDNKHCEKSVLSGVGCDVVNCVYNTNDRHCHAPTINVESKSALRKAETFCSTFSPKSSV